MPFCQMPFSQMPFDQLPFDQMPFAWMPFSVNAAIAGTEVRMVRLSVRVAKVFVVIMIRVLDLIANAPVAWHIQELTRVAAAATVLHVTKRSIVRHTCSA